MKTIISIIVIVVTFSSYSYSQNLEDIIYLKSGIIIHGSIIENNLNDSVKIKSGYNIFSYGLNEIDKITKEKPEETIVLSSDTGIKKGLWSPSKCLDVSVNVAIPAKSISDHRPGKADFSFNARGHYKFNNKAGIIVNYSYQQIGFDDAKAEYCYDCIGSLSSGFWHFNKIQTGPEVFLPVRNNFSVRFFMLFGIVIASENYVFETISFESNQSKYFETYLPFNKFDFQVGGDLCIKLNKFLGFFTSYSLDYFNPEITMKATITQNYYQSGTYTYNIKTKMFFTTVQLGGGLMFYF